MWHVPLLAVVTRWVGSKRVALGITKYRREDVELLKSLIENGEYRPVVDRTYPLDDVIEASRYVETGQKTGNVVLTVGGTGAEGESMKAVVHDRYGPPEVLRVDEVDRPEPADDEVLVRVHATTVTRTDIHMRAAKPFFWRFMLGLRRPRRRILGLEFAGVVEAVGASRDRNSRSATASSVCGTARTRSTCACASHG